MFGKKAALCNSFFQANLGQIFFINKNDERLTTIYKEIYKEDNKEYLLLKVFQINTLNTEY